MNNAPVDNAPGKRGRWYVVATIAVLALSGFTWLLWPPTPNVDPRLIGDWQSGPIVRRFNSDGTFETSGTPFSMTGYHWSVEGGEIVLSKPRTIGSQLRSRFDSLVSKLTGQMSLGVSPPRYQLLEVTADKLRIKPNRPNVTEEVYNRLP